jgi:hypothetical protein
MPVEMLTYAAISPEAARAPRSRSGRALVPLFGRRVDAFAMKACIDSVQRELAKVEAMAAAHRADFQRERDRAEHLVAELLKAGANAMLDAMADAMAARDSTARLEGELLELRSRPWWRRLGNFNSRNQRQGTAQRRGNGG